MVNVSSAGFQKRRDRQVLALADFTQEDIDAIERAVAPAEAAEFDHEAG